MRLHVWGGGWRRGGSSGPSLGEGWARGTSRTAPVFVVCYDLNRKLPLGQGHPSPPWEVGLGRGRLVIVLLVLGLVLIIN